MTAFPATLFAGMKFAVVGLGQNGRPAATALAAMGAEVTAWDDSETARVVESASRRAVLEIPPGGMVRVSALYLPGGKWAASADVAYQLFP